MNKFLAALLSLTLVFGSVGTVFANEADTPADGVEAAGEPVGEGEPDGEDGADDTAGTDRAGDDVGAATLSDIGGTVYEEAVTALFTKGIVTGDPAGTFRPEDSITKAEACVIVARAMGAADAELSAAADSGFTDLANYDWALKVINYTAEKGVVSGNGDGTFSPAKEVSFAEIAVMLIKAQGISAEEVTGEWPQNYIDKATQLGMLAKVAVSGTVDPNAAASRGNVAVMTYAALEAIEAAGLDTGATVPEDAGAADGGEAETPEGGDGEVTDNNDEDAGEADDADASTGNTGNNAN